MTLQEYRAAYDREEDFGQVTKELMQAWLDERIDAVKQIEEIKKSMNDYPLVWGRLIDDEYENEVDLCGWEPKLQLHIYEGIEHIAAVLGITLKCEENRGTPYDYEYSFVYKGVRVFEISEEAIV
jgi:hypothetical protein